MNCKKPRRGPFDHQIDVSFVCRLSRKVPSFHICSTQSCNLSFAIHKTGDNGQNEK